MQLKTPLNNLSLETFTAYCFAIKKAHLLRAIFATGCTSENACYINSSSISVFHFAQGLKRLRYKALRPKYVSTIRRLRLQPQLLFIRCLNNLSYLNFYVLRVLSVFPFGVSFIYFQLPRIANKETARV